MVTIGVYKLVSNSSLYEDRYLEIIKKLYKSAGKFDNQEQYKAILESSMVSTTEWITYNRTTDVFTLVNMNNPSARNLLGRFLALLDVTQRLLS